MKKRILHGILAGLLVFSLALAGCGGGGGGISTTALSTKISEAETLLASAVTGSDPAQITLGVPYATQAQKDELQDAIDDAIAVKNNPASQAAVNAEVITLDAAMDVFSVAINSQSGTKLPLNKHALEGKIAEAQLLFDNTIEAENAAEVLNVFKYATAAQKTALADAIFYAGVVLNNAVLQEGLDFEVNNLNTAINTFITGLQNGTKTGTTEDDLAAVIDAAKDAKAGIKVSVYGHEVKPSEQWVSATTLENFEGKIEEAEAVVSNYDDAIVALGAAITTFNNAKQFGYPINFSEAIDTIGFAKELKEGVLIRTSAELAPVGTLWVTQSEMDALNDAITAVENAINTAETYFELKVTVDALGSDAYDAFEAAIKDGTGKKSVTITGLSSFNGWDIGVALFAVESADELDFEEIIYALMSEQDIDVEAFSDEEIPVSAGSSTMELVTDDGMGGNDPWTGNGSYFVGIFLSKEDDGKMPIPRVYLSKTKVSFAGLNTAIALSAFDVVSFETTIVDIGDFMDVEVTAAMSLNDLFLEASEGINYTAIVGMYGENLFFKNESLTTPFSATETIGLETPIYSALPFELIFFMFADGDEGEGESEGPGGGGFGGKL